MVLMGSGRVGRAAVEAHDSPTMHEHGRDVFVIWRVAGQQGVLGVEYGGLGAARDGQGEEWAEGWCTLSVLLIYGIIITDDRS